MQHDPDATPNGQSVCPTIGRPSLGDDVVEDPFDGRHVGQHPHDPSI